MTQRTTINHPALAGPWSSATLALPAYASAIIVAFAGLLAAAATVDAPSFGGTALALMIVAIILNWLRSVPRQSWLHQLAQAGSLVLVIVIPIWAFLFDPQRFFPPVIFEVPDLHPLVLITWICVIAIAVTGRWGDTDYAPLSFIILPALSMLALSTPQNINIEVTLAMLLIVIAGTFLVAYETTMMRTATLGESHAVKRHNIISFHLYVAAQWSLMILGSAVVLSPVMYFTRSSVAPANVRFVAPRRYMFTTVEFSSFTRRLGLWGGPITLSQRKLFEIRGDYCAYWRVQAYNRYDNRGWYHFVTRLPLPAVQIGRAQYRFTASLPPRYRIVRATVRALNIPIYNFLSPGVPLLLRSNRALRRLRLLQDNVIRAQFSAGGPRWYSIVAAVNDAPIDELKRASGASRMPMMNEYLQLPSGLDRVIALARQVARGYRTPFEKALALSRYLKANCRYSLAPPFVPWHATDAVDYFLFESKEGACDFFASALAVMCRAVGIPSRVVTGYMSTEYDADKRTLTIRESDAHAWVEIYIPKYGWVTVDPTPPSARRRFFFDLLDWWRPVRRRLIRLARWHILEITIGLLLVIALTPIVRQRLHWFKQRFARRHRTPGEQLTSAYRNVVQALQELGVPYQPHYTPLEVATTLTNIARTNRQFHALATDVMMFMRDITLTAYAPSKLSDEMLKWLEMQSKRICKLAKQERKRTRSRNASGKRQL